jgi:hypothetical protein
MEENAQSQLSRDLDRRIGGNIVDDDTLIDAVERNLAIGFLKRLAGVISWHDNYYLFGTHDRSGDRLEKRRIERALPFSQLA